MPKPTVFPIAVLGLKIGAPGAFGPRQSFGVAVIGGIAVDNDGRGAVLLRGVDLHRSMASGVARHHDFASNVDSGGFHLGVVGRQSIIHVNHRRLNFAGSGIRDERRHQFWIRRVRVQRIRGFANIDRFLDGFNQSDTDGSRRREIHLKFVHLRLRPALSNPLRMVSATAMDAGVPAMCGRLVIVRWNWEIDSVESWAVYFASASRS